MKTKRILAALLVAALSFSQFSVALADKKTDAQNKKKQAEEELEEKKNEISNIQNLQESLQSEIDALDAELVQVMLDLSTLEEELSIKVDQLAQTKEDLKKAKKDEKKQYKAMKKRIQFMYEQGDSTLLTSILEAKSISDLLNRVEYFNEIYDYDRDLLTAYENIKKEVAALEKQQELEVAEMEKTQVKYQEAAANFQSTIAKKKDSLKGFDAKLAQAQELAAKYQDTIRAQESVIAAEEEREAAERAAAERAAAQRAAEQAAANQNGSAGGGNSAAGGSTSGGGNKNPGFSTNVSGSSVVQYAMQFVGNPYVWGGKDPNTGADCSGFTSYVYAHFGISIPSYSYSQRSVGKEVSYANAQPGDLICYAGHVAIYMGNGKIVHAKGTAYGIVANDNATYRQIITVRRVL